MLQLRWSVFSGLFSLKFKNHVVYPLKCEYRDKFVTCVPVRAELGCHYETLSMQSYLYSGKMNGNRGKYCK